MKDLKKADIRNILLVNLPAEGQCADFYTPQYAIDSFSVYPPLGLLYVATGVRDGYAVEVMDVVAKNCNIKQTVNEIVRRSPAVLGISSQTFRVYPLAEIARLVKSALPETIVVIGGPHTSLYPVETLDLPGVDHVIVGDGDKSFRKLVDALAKGDADEFKKVPGLVYKDDGKVVQNPNDYSISLDDMPMPDRSLLDYRYYYTAADGSEQVVTMISSRGCPFKCVFCDVQEKKYRYRSAKNVVDEMEEIARNFSNPMISIMDDTFNLLKDRVLDICSEIKKRNLKIKWATRARAHPFDEEMVIAMKDAGLERIHFGVESGSEITLDKIRKGISKEQIVKAFELCHKYGVDSLAYFIIGFDWETKKDINETISFIRQIKPNFVMVTTLYPAAGSKIYSDLISRGASGKDFWQEMAKRPVKDFRLPQYRNPKTQKYLNRKLDETYLTFYLSPSFVIKNLTSKKKGNKKAFSASEFLFRVKLSLLVTGSYLKNLFSELAEFKSRNEIV